MTKLGKNFVKLKSMTSKVRLACIAGGGVGVLYCFGGGAVRRVGVQVNLKSRLPQFLGILKSPQPGLGEFLIGYEAIKRQSIDH